MGEGGGITGGAGPADFFPAERAWPSGVPCPAGREAQPGLPDHRSRGRASAAARIEDRNRVGLDRSVGAALDREAQGPVERRELVLTQASGLSFPQSHPRDSDSPFHLVVQRHGVSSQTQTPGQRLQLFSRAVVDELRRIEDESESAENPPSWSTPSSCRRICRRSASGERAVTAPPERRQSSSSSARVRRNRC